MRNLLYLFVFAALLLGLSACSSYYYSMLNSNDPVGEKNERGDFVQENDTVRISYRFWGENAPVTITIYNKLDEPLYVDWGRSALIIDDVATTYDPKVASVRALAWHPVAPFIGAIGAAAGGATRKVPSPVM